VLNPLPNSDNNAEAYRFAGGYYFMKGDQLTRRDKNGQVIPSPESVKPYQRAADLLNRAASIMGWSSEDSAKFASSQPNGAAADAQRVLSMIYQRLNDTQKAYDAAVRAVQADPLSPDMYVQLSRVLIQSGQLEGAAVALLQGNTLTADRRLGTELLKLFQGPLDTAACALKPTGDGLALNPQCESVKRFLCPAIGNAIAVRIRTGHPELARELREKGLREYGCPISLLEQSRR
jgi:tetratricopeptide (TPR) repeat protein